jgi:threonine synthase
MDIQFAYNLERMLYYICNENPAIVKPIMDEAEKQFQFVSGAVGVQLDPIILSRIQETFCSCSVTDAETLRTIRSISESYDYLLCPHSAVGVSAALSNFSELVSTCPTVCVLTAHPVKFESAIVKATGHPPTRPAVVLELMQATPRFKWLRKSSADAAVWRREWIQTLKRDIGGSAVA